MRELFLRILKLQVANSPSIQQTHLHISKDYQVDRAIIGVTRGPPPVTHTRGGGDTRMKLNFLGLNLRGILDKRRGKGEVAGGELKKGRQLLQGSKVHLHQTKSGLRLCVSQSDANMRKKDC